MLLVITDKTLDDERHLNYLLKLFLKAGIEESAMILSTTQNKNVLWNLIKEKKPKIVLTLGQIATLVLTQKMDIGKEYQVKYMESPVLSWYHPSFLFKQPKYMDEVTINYFKKIKDRLCCQN